MSVWQSRWRVSIGLAMLCSFAVLAGCSLDVSNLRVTPNNDAAMSPDTVLPIGDPAGRPDAHGGLETSADANAFASDGPDGAGGNGGTNTDSSAGAGGSGGMDGRPATGDSPSVGSTGGDGGEDSAPTTYDSRGTDRSADTVASGGDDAESAVAAPEVGAAEVRDLGTDSYETGGKAQGDAGCLNDDCVPFIALNFPAAMKCNLDGSTAELSWSDLSSWNPTHDSRICDNAGTYDVQGTIVLFQPGLQLLADVYAPEDTTWYPISGGPIVQPDAAGGFDGSFCLPQKGLDRTFRFRIVKSNSSQDAGVACLIHVR